jgi:nucleoid-associated protein YgaU
MANSRYRYNKILTTNETKKQYLESTIYPKIKATDDDIYVISSSSDRLDLLAYQYYGDKNYWWIIAVANNLNDATFHIEPGVQLRIPGNIQNIIYDFEKINK